MRSQREELFPTSTSGMAVLELRSECCEKSPLLAPLRVPRAHARTACTSGSDSYLKLDVAQEVHAASDGPFSCTVGDED